MSNSSYLAIDGLICLVRLDTVNTTSPADTVWFTTKGQVVIPLRLRKLYHIVDGTRAIVTATDEGILPSPWITVLC